MYVFLGSIPTINFTFSENVALGETAKFQRCGHQLAAEVGNKW